MEDANARPRARKIDWTPQRYQKLFAATLAVHPELKLNYSKIAGYFGEGATYDAIETRFRCIKKDAKAISDAVASGQLIATPATPARFKRKAPAAPSTPSSSASSSFSSSAGQTRRQVKRPRTTAAKAAALPTPSSARGRGGRVQIKREVESDYEDTPEEPFSCGSEEEESDAGNNENGAEVNEGGRGRVGAKKQANGGRVYTFNKVQKQIMDQRKVDTGGGKEKVRKIDIEDDDDEDDEGGVGLGEVRGMGRPRVTSGREENEDEGEVEDLESYLQLPRSTSEGGWVYNIC